MDVFKISTVDRQEKSANKQSVEKSSSSFFDELWEEGFIENEANPEQVSSRVELAEFLEDNFNVLDLNGDRRVSKFELDSLERQHSSLSNSNHFQFVRRNYYVLKALSNDNDGFEKGLVKEDIDQLRSNSSPALGNRNALGAGIEKFCDDLESILTGVSRFRSGAASERTVMTEEQASTIISGVLTAGGAVGAAAGLGLGMPLYAATSAPVGLGVLSAAVFASGPVAYNAFKFMRGKSEIDSLFK